MPSGRAQEMRQAAAVESLASQLLHMRFENSITEKEFSNQKQELLREYRDAVVHQVESHLNTAEDSNNTHLMMSQKRKPYEEPFAHGSMEWMVRSIYDKDRIAGAERTFHFDEIDRHESEYLNSRPQPKGFGLTFSGGGVRAAAQGLGALRFLREKRLMHTMQYLSGVSGGTYVGTGYMTHVAAQREKNPAPPMTVDATEKILCDAFDSMEAKLKKRGTLVDGLEDMEVPHTMWQIYGTSRRMGYWIIGFGMVLVPSVLYRVSFLIAITQVIVFSVLPFLYIYINIAFENLGSCSTYVPNNRFDPTNQSNVFLMYLRWIYMSFTNQAANDVYAIEELKGDCPGFQTFFYDATINDVAAQDEQFCFGYQMDPYELGLLLGILTVLLFTLGIVRGILMSGVLSVKFFREQQYAAGMINSYIGMVGMLSKWLSIMVLLAGSFTFNSKEMVEDEAYTWQRWLLAAAVALYNDVILAGIVNPNPNINFLVIVISTLIWYLMAFIVLPEFLYWNVFYMQAQGDLGINHRFIFTILAPLVTVAGLPFTRWLLGALGYTRERSIKNVFYHPGKQNSNIWYFDQMNMKEWPVAPIYICNCTQQDIIDSKSLVSNPAEFYIEAPVQAHHHFEVTAHHWGSSVIGYWRPPSDLQIATPMALSCAALSQTVGSAAPNSGWVGSLVHIINLAMGMLGAEMGRPMELRTHFSGAASGLKMNLGSATGALNLTWQRIPEIFITATIFSLSLWQMLDLNNDIADNFAGAPIAVVDKYGSCFGQTCYDSSTNSLISNHYVAAVTYVDGPTEQVMNMHKDMFVTNSSDFMQHFFPTDGNFGSAAERPLEQLTYVPNTATKSNYNRFTIRTVDYTRFLTKEGPEARLLCPDQFNFAQSVQECLDSGTLQTLKEQAWYSQTKRDYVYPIDSFWDMNCQSGSYDDIMTLFQSGHGWMTGTVKSTTDPKGTWPHIPTTSAFYNTQGSNGENVDYATFTFNSTYSHGKCETKCCAVAHMAYAVIAARFACGNVPALACTIVVMLAIMIVAYFIWPAFSALSAVRIIGFSHLATMMHRTLGFILVIPHPDKHPPPEVFLTDGGHFEDLGAFPLIKRKVKCIVGVCSDPTRVCTDMYELMRISRQFLGCGWSVNDGSNAAVDPWDAMLDFRLPRARYVGMGVAVAKNKEELMERERKARSLMLGEQEHHRGLPNVEGKEGLQKWGMKKFGGSQVEWQQASVRQLVSHVKCHHGHAYLYFMSDDTLRTAFLEFESIRDNFRICQSIEKPEGVPDGYFLDSDVMRAETLRHSLSFTMTFNDGNRGDFFFLRGETSPDDLATVRAHLKPYEPCDLAWTTLSLYPGHALPAEGFTWPHIDAYAEFSKISMQHAWENGLSSKIRKHKLPEYPPQSCCAEGVYYDMETTDAALVNPLESVDPSNVCIGMERSVC